MQRLLIVLVSLLVGCTASPFAPGMRTATIEVGYLDSTIAGVRERVGYRVSGQTMEESREAAPIDGTRPAPVVRTVTLTAQQRGEVERLARDALAQRDLDARCTDSPSASLTVTWPGGRQETAAITYCGPNPPSGSALDALVRYLGAL